MIMQFCVYRDKQFTYWRPPVYTSIRAATQQVTCITICTRILAILENILFWYFNLAIINRTEMFCVVGHIWTFDLIM